MPAWVVILAIAVGAAALGAVVLSLVAVLFFWLLFPDALKDGQFGLIFFLTVPAGGLLGAGLGALLAYHRLGKPPIVGWVWWVGSSLVGALVLFLTLGWPPGHSIPWIWIIERIVRRLPRPHI